MNANAVGSSSTPDSKFSRRHRRTRRRRSSRPSLTLKPLLINTSGVAILIQKPETGVRDKRCRAAWRLPEPFKIGRDLVWRLADIEAYVANQA
jgi:hypothetical protein